MSQKPKNPSRAAQGCRCCISLGAKTRGSCGQAGQCLKKSKFWKKVFMVLFKTHFCTGTAAELTLFPLKWPLARAVCSHFFVSLLLKWLEVSSVAVFKISTFKPWIHWPRSGFGAKAQAGDNARVSHGWTPCRLEGSPLLPGFLQGTSLEWSRKAETEGGKVLMHPAKNSEEHCKCVK